MQPRTQALEHCGQNNLALRWKLVKFLGQVETPVTTHEFIAAVNQPRSQLTLVKATCLLQMSLGEHFACSHRFTNNIDRILRRRLIPDCKCASLGERDDLPMHPDS